MDAAAGRVVLNKVGFFRRVLEMREDKQGYPWLHALAWPAAFGLLCFGAACAGGTALDPAVHAVGAVHSQTMVIPAGTPALTKEDAAPSTVTQLTQCQSQCFFPAWSPDRKEIAYFSGAMNGIMLMDADGGNARAVTFKAAGWAPVWSPDGKHIAFTSGQGGEMYVSTPDGSEVRRLSGRLVDPQLNPPFYPSYAWSPDGASLAYVRADGKQYVLLVTDLGGGEPRELFGGTSSMQFLGWLNDGKIYLLVEEANNSVLYAAAIDGSDPQRLAELPSGSFDSVMSPDGTQIVFNAREPEDGTEKFWLMDVGDSRKMILMPGIAGYPAWSPDGTRIAFSYSGMDGDLDIYVLQNDGSGLMNATSHPGFADRESVWSRDGLRLVFVACTFSEDGFWADDQIFMVEVPPV
jgi:Tol biopolymer transport system component